MMIHNKSLNYEVTLDVGLVAGGDLEVGVAQGEVGALIIQNTAPAPEPVTMLSSHWSAEEIQRSDWSTLTCPSLPSDSSHSPGPCC